MGQDPSMARAPATGSTDKMNQFHRNRFFMVEGRLRVAQAWYASFGPLDSPGQNSRSGKKGRQARGGQKDSTTDG